MWLSSLSLLLIPSAALFSRSETFLNETTSKATKWNSKKSKVQHQSANKSNSFPTFHTDLPVLLHSYSSQLTHTRGNNERMKKKTIHRKRNENDEHRKEGKEIAKNKINDQWTTILSTEEERSLVAPCCVRKRSEWRQQSVPSFNINCKQNSCGERSMHAHRTDPEPDLKRNCTMSEMPWLLLARLPLTMVAQHNTLVPIVIIDNDGEGEDVLYYCMRASQ